MKLLLKLFLIINSLMYSSMTIASSTPKDSWHVLRTSQDVIILQPNLPLNVFNACYSDYEIKTIKPEKKCTAYDQEVIGTPTTEGGGYFEYKCTNYELVNISFPRDHQERICIKNAASDIKTNECLQYKNQEKSYPRTYKLDVIAASGENSLQHLFFKEYTLPECL